MVRPAQPALPTRHARNTNMNEAAPRHSVAVASRLIIDVDAEHRTPRMDKFRSGVDNFISVAILGQSCDGHKLGESRRNNDVQEQPT